MIIPEIKNIYFILSFSKNVNNVTIGSSKEVNKKKNTVTPRGNQGRREPERAPGHNLRAGPSDIFSFNSVTLK